MTASTSISPRLYRETVNIIRGLELEHDLEVTLDGERVVLARFGGPKDEQANYLQPTLAGDEMEKRFQKRLKVTAGPHDVGVAFIKKSSATTLELLQPFERERLDPITPVGIPELDRVTVEGPFNPVKSDALTEPQASLHVHTGVRSRRAPLARERFSRRSRAARIADRSTRPRRRGFSASMRRSAREEARSIRASKAR